MSVVSDEATVAVFVVVGALATPRVVVDGIEDIFEGGVTVAWVMEVLLAVRSRDRGGEIAMATEAFMCTGRRKWRPMASERKDETMPTGQIW